MLPRSLFGEIAAPESAVTVGARTEHLRIAKANGVIAGIVGSVSWIEHLGDRNHLHLKIDGVELVTLADPDNRLDVGDAISVELVKALFFDAAGKRIAS